jgi:flagellar motor switch protein FliN/FliY
MWKKMNSGLLSQEEIDALLNGVDETPPGLSDSDKDLLGEIGNISMGSASTALSTIISKMVNITTPRVRMITLAEIKGALDVPNIALEVEYIEGLTGVNLLVMKVKDAVVIADLMMGGTGDKQVDTLSEIEISAVSEAMNQMIGSSATSLSTMLGFPINISPPIAKLWDDKTMDLTSKVDEDEELVRISFKLTIDPLVDSEIMLILPLDTAKYIINKMSSFGSSDEDLNNEFDIATGGVYASPPPAATPAYSEPVQNDYYKQEIPPQREEVVRHEPPVNVQRAQFAPLTQLSPSEKHNIDLILDVPLEISVVLGRTKKTIKEILELGTGSLVELDKMTEEPVEILVNGKKVALGEVVVVNENFGVRITSIVSNAERVKSLNGK